MNNVRDTTPNEPAPVDLAGRAVEFARSIGPASERSLASPAAQTVVVARLRGGYELEDAVLWHLHQEARTDPQVADEFVASLVRDLLQVARPAVSSGLRRFVDSGDLVQSVLGDLWSKLGSVQFETRAQFVALVAQRIRWKAADRRRSLERDRRREDLREKLDVDDIDPVGTTRSPESLVGIQDEFEALVLKILRLPERDQLLVRLHLRGDSLESIASAVELEPESARKALQRAIRRLRELP